MCYYQNQINYEKRLYDLSDAGQYLGMDPALLIYEKFHGLRAGDIEPPCHIEIAFFSGQEPEIFFLKEDLDGWIDQFKKIIPQTATIH